MKAKQWKTKCHVSSFATSNKAGDLHYEVHRVHFFTTYSAGTDSPKVQPPLLTTSKGQAEESGI